MFVPTTNDLVLECSALEFGRDSSAEEEDDEEEEAEGEIEECEEALERYELDHEEALEQLINDTHDVRLDRLEDAYEECRRVRMTRRSSTAFVGESRKTWFSITQHWSSVVIHPREKRKKRRKRRRRICEGW